MMEILAVGPAASFDEFKDEIGVAGDASIERVGSGAEALAKLSEKKVDLVVIDETLKDMTGLDLARQVAFRNPMTAVALVSAVSPEDFHEATEGLGILAQLSPRPGRRESRSLIETLSKVMRMTRIAGATP
jgi:CheY-like chemotaxis protein